MDHQLDRRGAIRHAISTAALAAIGGSACAPAPPGVRWSCSARTPTASCCLPGSGQGAGPLRCAGARRPPLAPRPRRWSGVHARWRRLDLRVEQRERPGWGGSARLRSRRDLDRCPAVARRANERQLRRRCNPVGHVAHLRGTPARPGLGGRSWYRVVTSPAPDGRVPPRGRCGGPGGPFGVPDRGRARRSALPLRPERPELRTGRLRLPRRTTASSGGSPFPTPRPP
jgi:hypothetical protein